MIQTGYYMGMLASGAGALVIAARFGWFAVYATMAVLHAVSMLTFLLGPEPNVAAAVSDGRHHAQTNRRQAVAACFATAVIATVSRSMPDASRSLIVLP